MEEEQDEKYRINATEALRIKQEQEAIERTLLTPNHMFQNVYIAWKKPETVPLFSFPFAVVKVMQRNGFGKVQTYIHRTDSFERIEDILTDLYSRFVHPNFRQFFNRVLFDQHREITLHNEDYIDALNKFKEYLRKTES